MMPPLLIVCQFIGFLLQTLPVIILGFVPFPDDSFPIPRRRLTAVFSGAIVALSMGFTLMSILIYTPTTEHNALLRAASNIYMTVCILLWIAAFFLSIRSSVMKKTLVLVLLIHYSAAIFTFIGIICGKLFNVTKATAGPLHIYGPDTIRFHILLLAATFPLVYLFLKKEIQFGLSYMENRTLRRGCLYMLLSLLLFAVCVFFLSTSEFYYGFYEWATIAFLLAFMLTDCIIYFMFFAEVNLTMQIRQSEERLRSFDEQYRQITANIAEARRIRHDVRHHLTLIGTMNRSGEHEALDEYLKSYEASFLAWEQASLCGYPAFDSILQYYIECAREQNIAVNTQMHALRKNLDFDIIDITVMVGNLMENAIEACKKLPHDSSPFIHIWVKQMDAVFLLELKNSCEATTDTAAQQDFTDGSSFPSTKHPLSRGQGLKSIRFAAEKYGGSAEFKKANGVFTARIVMNIP